MTDEQIIKDAWRRARGWCVDGEVLNVDPRHPFRVQSWPTDDAPLCERIEPVRFHREFLRDGPPTVVQVIGRYKDATLVVER